MEIIEFDKNKIERFAHSNQLIEARYSLNLEEERLVLMMVSMVMPSDNDFKCYRIKFKEFADFFNIKGDSIIAHLKKTAKSLVGKPITIKDANKTLYLSWISSAEFPEDKNEENGEKNYVELSFDPKLKPYLLKMKEKYTFLEYKYLIKLRSRYSIRIYMLLKQYLDFKEQRKFAVEMLREIFGMDNLQYPRFYDFKVNVLQKATTEINGKTDLMIALFDGKKIGKRPIEVIFTIREKTQEEKKAMENENEVFGENEENGVKPKDIKNEENGDADFQEVYLAFNPGKKLRVFPFSKNKTRFLECLKQISGKEELLLQITDYLEYLKVATWRQKKDFSAWINDPSSYANDWKAEKLAEEEKQKQNLKTNAQKRDELAIREAGKFQSGSANFLKHEETPEEKKLREKWEEEMRNFQPTWKKIQEALQENFPDSDEYEKWLSGLEVFSKGEKEIILAAPSKFIRDWVIREFVENKEEPNLKSVISKIIPVEKVSVIWVSNPKEN